MLMQRWTPDSGSRDLGHLIERGLGGPWAFDPWSSLRGHAYAPASIEETEQGVVVRVELPGVDPELIDVDLVERQLTVSIERQETNGSEGGHATAGRFRAFRQAFRLPYAVDPEAVVAETRHGVLTVTLPKPAEAMPKRIPVNGA